MHRTLKSLFVLLAAGALAFGCSSSASSRPASIAKPAIGAHLTHPLFFGSGNQSGANIEVVVTNNATVPIKVRRVEVDSPGMASYTIGRSVRDFQETLAPGQTKSFLIFATATTLTDRPVEPLAVRTIVEIAAGGSVWREVGMDRRAGN